nr:PRC-barrel domain-containing protein [Pedobacter sp. ASV2]
MNSGNIEYINLEELANTDYKIIEGQAQITDWPVVDESGNSVGKVKDLLFDPSQNTIRYIIVQLNSNIADKSVLIPIGLVNLGQDNKEVILPVMSESQFKAMPQYIIAEVTRETELQIRAAIGSPAALRIEEEIVEMDHTDFYSHHHFDRGNKQSNLTDYSTEKTSEFPVMNDRKDVSMPQDFDDNYSDRATVSHQQDHITKYEQFRVQIQEGIFVVEPQENGTYRILDGENKIGVIYAESSSLGIQWRTMDNLHDNFIINLGQAISAHNTSENNI